VFTHLSLWISFLLCLTSAQWQFNYAKQGRDWFYATPPPGWSGVNRCDEPEN